MDGEGLLELSREDMRDELGMKKLQVDKLVKHLGRLQLGSPTSEARTVTVELDVT